MDTTLQAVVPTLVALVSGLVGGFLTGRRQSALEYQKWLRGRADDHAKEARLAVAELTKSLGSATHAMAWIAWKARHRPHLIASIDIDQYDREIHGLLPAITGGLSVVSALSEPLFQRMEPLVQEVYRLDVCIADAATRFLEQQEGKTVALGECLEGVVEMGRSLNQKVADILRNQAEGVEAKLR